MYGPHKDAALTVTDASSPEFQSLLQDDLRASKALSKTNSASCWSKF